MPLDRPQKLRILQQMAEVGEITKKKALEKAVEADLLDEPDRTEIIKRIEQLGAEEKETFARRQEIGKELPTPIRTGLGELAHPTKQLIDPKKLVEFFGGEAPGLTLAKEALVTPKPPGEPEDPTTAQLMGVEPKPVAFTPQQPVPLPPGAIPAELEAKIAAPQPPVPTAPIIEDIRARGLVRPTKEQLIEQRFEELSEAQKEREETIRTTEFLLRFSPNTAQDALIWAAAGPAFAVARKPVAALGVRLATKFPKATKTLGQISRKLGLKSKLKFEKEAIGPVRLTAPVTLVDMVTKRRYKTSSLNELFIYMNRERKRTIINTQRIVRGRVWGKERKFFVAEDVLRQATAGAIFPKQISTRISRLADAVVSGYNMNVTLDMALTAMARGVWKLGNAKKIIVKSEKEIGGKIISRTLRRPAKTVPKEIRGSKMEEVLKYTIAKNLALHDPDVLKLASIVLPRTATVGMARAITRIRPNADVKAVLENIRIKLLPHADPVDGMKQVGKVIKKSRSERVVKLIEDATDEVEVFKLAKEKRISPHKAKMFFADNRNEPPAFFTKGRPRQGRPDAINVEVSKEIAERVEVKGGRAAGGYDELRPIDEFALDVERGIQAIEGRPGVFVRPATEIGISTSRSEIPTPAKGTFVGAIRRKFNALNESRIKSASTSKLEIDQITKMLDGMTSGSSESHFMHLYLTGRMSTENMAKARLIGLTKKQMELYRQRMMSYYLPKVKQMNAALQELGRPTVTAGKTLGDQLDLISSMNKFYGNLAYAPESEFAEAVPVFTEKASRLARQMVGVGRDLPPADAVSSMHAFARIANGIISTNKPATDMIKHGELLQAHGLKVAGGMLIDSGEAFLNPARSADAFGGALLPKLPFNLGRVAAAMNRNLVRSLIFANPSVIVNQAFSVPFMAQNCGMRNVFRGAMDIMDDGLRSLALKNSQVIRARRILGTEFIPSGLEKGTEFTNFLLKYVDEGISLWAYLSGRRAAIQNGLRGDAINSYADSIAQRANVLYINSNIPKILRSRMVRLLFPIQTFTFNNMNNIRFDWLRESLPPPGEIAKAFGKKSAFFVAGDPAKNAERAMRLGIAMKFTGTTMLVNLAQAMMGLEPGASFEDFVPGLRSARIQSRPGVAGAFNVGIISHSIRAGVHLSDGWARDEADFMDFALQVAPLMTTIPGYTMLRRFYREGEVTPQLIFRQQEEYPFTRSITPLPLSPIMAEALPVSEGIEDIGEGTREAVERALFRGREERK